MLKVLNVFKCDEGRQRCRIGPNIFNDLNIRPGDHLRIELTKQLFVICKAFCRDDNCNDFLSFDSTVLSCDDVWLHENSKSITGQYLETSSLIPLQIQQAKTVFLKVISRQEPSTFAKKTSLSFLKQSLFGICLIKNTRVKFHERRRKVFDVLHVQIEDVEGKAENSLGLHDAFVVSDSTVIKVTSIINESLWTQISNNRVKEIYAYDHVTEKLKSMFFNPINHALACEKLGIRTSNGIMLIGPSGVGKTSFVKYFSKKFKIYLMEADISSILKSDPGDSERELRNLFHNAKQMSKDCPCILFFDQIETICGKRSNRGHTLRLLTQMLTLLDGLKDRGSMVILAATSQPNAIDSALRRPGRFDLEINMSIPNHAQRMEILERYFLKTGLKVTINFDDLAIRTRGYTGADLELLFVNSVYNALKCLKEQADHINISDENVINALKVKPLHEKTSSFIIETPKVQWSDIGGLLAVKSKMRQVIEWPLLQKSAFHRLGLKRPNGILLFGPPGCCKTMLVRAAATACNVSFVSASAAHVFSPYVGDSERLISDAFRQARNSMPCILFFDEIDSLAGSRSSSTENNVQQRILSTLLNEMDGIGTAINEIPGYDYSDVNNSKTNNFESNGVLFVAATNRPDLLDDALIRPGRLDRILYVPPPNYNDRISILKNLLGKIPHSNIDIEFVAAKTDKFSGADIVGLCREACLLAMERDISKAVIQMQDFDLVLQSMKPSISEKQLNFYREYIDSHDFVM